MCIIGFYVDTSNPSDNPSSAVLPALCLLAPGQVSELSYEETTDTSLTLTWASPKEPNGRLITAFLVEHKQSQNESSAASMEIGVGQPMRAVIKGLGKLLLLHTACMFSSSYIYVPSIT